MQKRVCDPVETLGLFRDDPFEARMQALVLSLARFPDIQDDCFKESHVSGLRLQLRQEFGECEFHISFFRTHAATLRAMAVGVGLFPSCGPYFSRFSNASSQSRARFCALSSSSGVNNSATISRVGAVGPNTTKAIDKGAVMRVSVSPDLLQIQSSDLRTISR